MGIPGCSTPVGMGVVTTSDMGTSVPSLIVPVPESTLLPPSSMVTDGSIMESQHAMHYGVTYPYLGNDWNESERLAIREHLTYLQSMGINTVIQVFSSQMIVTGTQENWLIFLDEAQRLGIQVVANLYPSNVGDGDEFNYQSIDEFLSVIQGHPALLAYLGLHEPMEKFRSEQLQAFYRHIKEVAPTVRVAHYLDDMASFDTSTRFPGRRFVTEICDICIIWYYPAISKSETSTFDIEYLQKMVRSNRALVDERSPDSELWFLGQAYSSQLDELRMPSPKEMETIFNLATQEGVDGFLWYPWLHDQYDMVLSDSYMYPQREAVRIIYEAYILISP
jgi:hypothetical protein